MDDIEDESSFLAFAGIRFGSTALLAPLDSAKILQQVNYIPSDDFLDSRGLRPASLATGARADEPGARDDAGPLDDGSDVGWPRHASFRASDASFRRF